jgi:E3 ubiquitin-protein ligase SHPRH
VIQALKANDISFVALDKGGKQAGDMVEQFHKDESITVFLLHAERERYVLMCRKQLELIWTIVPV